MTESVGSPPTGTPALPRETVPWVDPQAQVTDVVVIGGGPGGEVPPAAEASERGPVVHVVDVSTGEVPGSSVLSEGMDGTARLVIDHQCSVLVGVTISGGGVKEMLHAATVTVGARVSLTELWHAVPAFPTVAGVWPHALAAAGS